MNLTPTIQVYGWESNSSLTSNTALLFTSDILDSQPITLRLVHRVEHNLHILFILVLLLAYIVLPGSLSLSLLLPASFVDELLWYASTAVVLIWEIFHSSLSFIFINLITFCLSFQVRSDHSLSNYFLLVMAVWLWPPPACVVCCEVSITSYSTTTSSSPTSVYLTVINSEVGPIILMYEAGELRGSRREIILHLGMG